MAQSWRPRVPGVTEVLHADFATHAYPAHVHDDWTLLLIDAGAVSYRLHRHDRIADTASITLLPPGVPHDGRTAVDGRAFRKKVLYLRGDWLDAGLADRSVDRPAATSARLLRSVRRIHEFLRAPGDELAAETLLHDVRTELVRQLATAPGHAVGRADLARALRELLDEHIEPADAPLTLERAAALLGAHPSHLGRAFANAFQLSPHRYLIARRIDRARHLLLDGMPPADVAQRLGFHDQPHFTRHFRRMLGTTPARFARGSSSRV